MISIHFTADDLARMRFAYRPLLEIPFSYRVLVNPAVQSGYESWLDEARHSLHDVELPYLSALVRPRGYIPDFLTPTPDGVQQDIEADIADLLATPNDLIQQNIAQLIQSQGNSDIRQHFLVYPHEALECLVEEIRTYWQHVLAHYWFQMTSTLESNILHHARTLALDGPGEFFEKLHPTVSYQNSFINFHSPGMDGTPPDEMYLEGRGLQVVPMIFRANGCMHQITPHWLPMVTYEVDGTGLWHQKTPPCSKALETALGAGRARMLVALMTPKSNGELARALNLTSGAVSQQMARLTKAGLVEQHRIGKYVYFRLTRRGDELIDLFGRVG